MYSIKKIQCYQLSKKAIKFASEDLDIYYCNIGNAYKIDKNTFASKNY